MKSIFCFSVMIVFFSTAISGPQAQSGDMNTEPIIIPGRLKSLKIKEFVAQNEPLKVVVARIDKIFFDETPDFAGNKFFKPKDRRNPSIFLLDKEVEDEKVDIAYSDGNLLHLLNALASSNHLKINYLPSNCLLISKADLVGHKKTIIIKNRVVAEADIISLLQDIEISDFDVKSVNLYQSLEILKKKISLNQSVKKKLVFTPLVSNNEQKNQLLESPLSIKMKISKAYDILNYLMVLLETDYDISIKIEVREL
jgi:hypothetical protein